MRLIPGIKFVMTLLKRIIGMLNSCYLFCSGKVQLSVFPRCFVWFSFVYVYLYIYII